MEGLESFGDGLFENTNEFEEDFRSCCDNEDWQDSEECLAEFSCEEDEDEDVDEDDVSSNEDVDESSLRMFFKGVSVLENDGLGSKASGIGVIMETSAGVSIVQVQKKLDFFVEDLVAEHLALLDGLIEARRNGAQRIVAFTDSVEVYHQIAEAEPHKDQLLVALGYRILELADNFEAFVLKLVCKSELERPLKLAKEAVGILDDRLICLCEERKYCPFPNCSALLSPGECSSSSTSSSFLFDVNCVECQECRRLVCTSCGVPWHASMSCEEYQSLSDEERDAQDATLLNNNWRRCVRCTRMIELTQGCFHLTCWCGHEFCYSCGTEYHNGAQTCQCVFINDRGDDYNSEPPSPSNFDSDQWRWEQFNPLQAINTDGYSDQERAQLALIQTFLTGGLGFSDENLNIGVQSPPRCSESYLDTIKDLNQLPWLERFVSVISDSYHEEYIQ